MITNKKLIKINWYRHCLNKLKTINKKDTNLRAKIWESELLVYHTMDPYGLAPTTQTD